MCACLVIHTRNTIKRTTFTATDIVIVATLTNDARQTNKRRRLTIEETKDLQSEIVAHATKYISADQVVFLEAPPNLSSEEDVFDYNESTYDLASAWGARFGPILVGDDHIYRDGLHLRSDARHLLIKTLACAILRKNPHLTFKMERPPHGPFGPWKSRKGEGMMPKTFGTITESPPFYFRRNHVQKTPTIPPLLRY